MSNTDDNMEADILRAKAEELLKSKKRETGTPSSEIDALKLVHELEVHQIELEMMNAQLSENAEKEKVISAELLVTHEELNRAHLREAELAENKYVKLYDFAPAGYFTLSKEGEILQLNLTGASLLGKERSKLLQARFGFFVSDDTKSVFNAFLEKVFYNNVSKFCEVSLVRNSKERLTVQLTGIANENSGECSISAVDITERIKTEETSRANEIRYRTLYTKAIDGIMFLSLDSKIATVNESFAKMHGYTVDELQSMSLQDLDTSETSRSVSERISRISSGETITFEVEHYHKDGHIIILEVSASLVSIGNEKIIQSFHREITERKQAEVLLKNEHLRLQGIIEGTNVGTWEWNIQTGETIYNDRWGEIIGYSLEELSPSSITTWQNLAHPNDLKRSAELLGRHLAGELPYYICECRIKHKQGHWVWVLDRGSIITRSAEGVPLKMFGTHTDITDRKKIETERERLIKKLQSALAEVKTLKGIVPICSGCKKIRDDEGFWQQVETYVQKHTDAKFSHGFCPDCVEKYYPSHAEQIRNKAKE